MLRETWAGNRKMAIRGRDGDDIRSVAPVLVPGFALVAMGLVLAGVVFISPPKADALPAYAQQTHLACGQCHVNPAGGGERTAFGKAFAANGHKLATKDGGKQQGANKQEGADNKKTAETGAAGSPSIATPSSS